MQDTNLKISPYFDDFDRSKNYQKILLNQDILYRLES